MHLRSDDMKTCGRREFIALGAAAATGLAKAQSVVVKNRMRKGVPDPLAGYKSFMPVWGDRI